jgi:transcriptional regulator with XRE-family HTH domain
MAFRGDRLRQTRELRGLSQRDLAAMCAIGHVLIYRYENAVSEPSFKHLTMIAEKLAVSIDYLAGLSDNMRGQIGDKSLEREEIDMLETYRRDGWAGVIRLGVEKLSK